MQIKYLIIVVLLFPFVAHADVTAEAKQLFTDYLDSLHEQNYTKLISLMDDNFLEETGGEDEWKSVVQDPRPKKVVDQVEVEQVGNYYFASYSTLAREDDDEESGFETIVLVRKGGKLLLHQFPVVESRGCADSQDSTPEALWANQKPLAIKLFTDYLDSLHEQDYTKLISLMDDNFLEETGGKDKWKSVVQDPHPKKVVKTVDVRRVNEHYFARFGTTAEGEYQTDSVWFVLVDNDGKLVFHALAQDFVSEAR